MSTSSEHRIVLDLHEYDSQANINITQYDTNRVFYFIISDDGKPFDLSGCFCELKAKKPDGTILYNNCTVANNMITYQLTAATSAAVGIVECELIIQRAGVSTVDIPRVATPRFTVTVNESVYNDGEITSTDEFTALTEAIAQANRLNISVRNSDSTVEIILTKKDGTTETFTINGSAVSGSEGSGSGISIDDVEQMISRKIGQLKSGYLDEVEAGSSEAVKSSAIVNYVSSIIGLLSEDMQRYVNEQIAAITDGDEVGW